MGFVLEVEPLVPAVLPASSADAFAGVDEVSVNYGVRDVDPP